MSRTARLSGRSKAILSLLGVVVLVVLALWIRPMAGHVADPPPTGTPATTAVSDDGGSGDRDSGDHDSRDHEQGGRDPDSGLPWVDLASLPQQARDTVALIDQGGPFPYDRDGIVFQNREGLLPGHARGYYHEYTVPTPGESDRGARRIIAGQKGELYWTADHYASFSRIRR